MKAANLLHADSDFPASMTLIVALLLLAIGFMAIFSMNFNVGPFGG
jgi:putative membrane protein